MYRPETTTVLRVPVGWPYGLGSSMRNQGRSLSPSWPHEDVPAADIDITYGCLVVQEKFIWTPISKAWRDKAAKLHLQMRLLTWVKLPTSMLRWSDKMYTRKSLSTWERWRKPRPMGIYTPMYEHPYLLVLTQEGCRIQKIWSIKGTIHLCDLDEARMLCTCLSH